MKSITLVLLFVIFFQNLSLTISKMHNKKSLLKNKMRLRMKMKSFDLNKDVAPFNAYIDDVIRFLTKDK